MRRVYENESAPRSCVHYADRASASAVRRQGESVVEEGCEGGQRNRKRIYISSLKDLCRIGDDPNFPMDDVCYIQTRDIDMSLSREMEGGFSPIIGYSDDGNFVIPFSGSYDGQGYSVKNLYIRSPKPNQVGLFASLAEDAVVKNLKIVDAEVVGMSEVGILAGHNLGRVSKCHIVSGKVRGESMIGGLIGNNMGDIDGCRVSGESVICGEREVGGLVGQLFGDYVSADDDDCIVEDKRGTIIDCSVSAKVMGRDCAGGIAGVSIGGRIIACDAKKVVTAGTTEETGDFYELAVKDKYGSGINVGGVSNIGGLVGVCTGGGMISGCNAFVNVNGHCSVGGIFGSCDSTLGRHVTLSRVKYFGNENVPMLGSYGDTRAFSAIDILEKVREYCVTRDIDLEEFMYYYR